MSKMAKILIVGIIINVCVLVGLVVSDHLYYLLVICLTVTLGLLMMLCSTMSPSERLAKDKDLI